jgi:hypothetical protein
MKKTIAVVASLGFFLLCGVLQEEKVQSELPPVYSQSIKEVAELPPVYSQNVGSFVELPPVY